MRSQNLLFMGGIMAFHEAVLVESSPLAVGVEKLNAEYQVVKREQLKCFKMFIVSHGKLHSSHGKCEATLLTAQQIASCVVCKTSFSSYLSVFSS